jgi:hypothetical protein
MYFSIRGSELLYWSIQVFFRKIACARPISFTIHFLKITSCRKLLHFRRMCSSTPQESLLTAQVSFNSSHSWQKQRNIAGPSDRLSPFVTCNKFPKRKNKLPHEQSEKVTHTELKLRLTIRELCLWLWPANHMWKISNFWKSEGGLYEIFYSGISTPPPSFVVSFRWVKFTVNQRKD